MLNVSQSLLQPDQYRFGIKSRFTIYCSNIVTQMTHKLNQLCYYDLQLEIALCYQHYFCNTELKLTTKTNKRTFELDTTEHICIICII